MENWRKEDDTLRECKDFRLMGAVSLEQGKETTEKSWSCTQGLQA